MIDPLLREKLFPETGDSIPTQKKRGVEFIQNNGVLSDAYTAWNSLYAFREQAYRNKMYVFGDQWGDLVYDPDCGKTMTERESILSQGKVPLTNNRLRTIIRSVLGLFSSQQTQPVCVPRNKDAQELGETMSIVMEYIYQHNETWELDRRNLEYFLITGFGAFKTTYGHRNNETDVWHDIINYSNFFFDTHTKDPRMWDANLVGQIHTISWPELLSRFANTDNDVRILEELYRGVDKERTASNIIPFLKTNMRNIHSDFFIPEDNTQCRVIEVWKKEKRKRYFIHDYLTGEYYKEDIKGDNLSRYEMINEQRAIEQTAKGVKSPLLLSYSLKYDTVWRCYFLTPFGHVLKEMDSPYSHKEHPYSFKVYPFYDNNAYPFVGDFIDQQRYINRMITLQDFMIGASAKGVLMFPEEAKPQGMSMDEIADQWTRYDGVIYYKAKGGITPPQQIVSQQRHTGISDMLQIQFKLLDDISGVQGALQGQAPSAGTPAALFAQQSQNSANTLTDILETYKSLRETRDKKTMHVTQQYYTGNRVVNVAGASFGSATAEYNSETMKDIDFDLSISESTSTPAYRMINNEFLMTLWEKGSINVKQLLQAGSFPFSEQLLQSINTEEEKMEEMQQQGQDINLQESTQNIMQAMPQGQPMPQPINRPI